MTKEKCGIFRNRHKWKEPVDNYRICTKCGITEYYAWVQDSWGARLQWKYLLFDDWKKAVDRFTKVTMEESQEKALQWLEKNDVSRQPGVA